MMNGGKILVLQRILGHADIKMTMRYFHFPLYNLEDAIKFNDKYKMNNKNTIFSFATCTAYAFFCSLIYQWSFWNQFNIDIMQFISINDLLPSVAFSILAPVTFAGCYAVALHLFFDTRLGKKLLNNKDTTSIILNIECKKSHPLKRSKASIIFSIITLISMTVMLIKVFYEDYNYGLHLAFIVFFTMIAVTVPLKLFIEKISSTLGKYTAIVMATICCMPMALFIAGNHNAANIIKGIDTLIVRSDSLCSKEKNLKYRYISTISDKAFALSLKDNSICIFKFNSLTLVNESSSASFMPSPLPANQL